MKATEFVTEAEKSCPPATQDITLNLKNRQKAIDEYGYGPLNPDLPNDKFWQAKVDEWNLDSAEEAKQSLCGNCAAFDQRQDTLACIAQGIGSDAGAEDPTIEAGDLGYCRFLKFKCASRRTCDAWVTGGPLTDKEPVDENLHDWFGKEKWVRMDTKGNIKGDCARGSSSEGKPKCLPQAKAHALGKAGRASAAQKKRRQDPNPERRGPAKNVATRVKESRGGNYDELNYRKSKTDRYALLDRTLDAVIMTDNSLSKLKQEAIEWADYDDIVTQVMDQTTGKQVFAVNGYEEAMNYLDENCWKGYHKEGNKELFGKTVPNCVKNEAAIGMPPDSPPAIVRSGPKISQPQAPVANLPDTVVGVGVSTDISMADQKAEHDLVRKAFGVSGDITKYMSILNDPKVYQRELDHQQIGNKIQTTITLKKKTTNEARHKAKQGVAEGSEEITWIKPNFDYEWDEIEFQAKQPQVPADVRNYMARHFPNKQAWMKSVQHGRPVVVRPDHGQKIRNYTDNKRDLLNALSPASHDPQGPAKEKRVNALFDKGGPIEMPIILQTEKGLWLIGGKTRLGTANLLKGIPAKVWMIGGEQTVAEGHESCPECGGAMYPDTMITEKQDACYYKVKSRYKIWPSAYASGALVQCRKKGAANWGNKSKNESQENHMDELSRILELAGKPVKNKMLNEGHADQQRKVFKKNGQPVGEVGIDRESSPGVGQYYMKHYASGKDLSGYDSFEEAVAELKHCMKQGVTEDAELAEEFDLIESIIENLALHNGVDSEAIWEDLESLDDDELYVFATTTTIMENTVQIPHKGKMVSGKVVRKDPVSGEYIVDVGEYGSVRVPAHKVKHDVEEDWQKANKRDKTDGMSRKAVKTYRREHPGSKLQTAVTTKPSKLKKGSKASKRRKSYCSRSRGQMKMHNISCAKTPDKAICKARRRWNC